MPKESIDNLKGIVILGFLITVLLLSCDHGLAPTPPSPTDTGFSGRVTFIGEWPQDTKECWIVVLKEMPTTPSQAAMFILQAPKDSIPKFVSHYDYTFYVPEGEYKIVFVALLRYGQFWGLNSVVGVYFENGDSSACGLVRVREGKITRNININVDFNHIPVPIPGLPTKYKKERIYEN